MTDPMFAEERRRVILDQLNEKGRVTVRTLSKELLVSAVTIRQDLRALEKAGLLERTYGGAVARSGSPIVQELSFHQRQRKNRSQKDAIAAAAAALLQDGCSIALDSSTTAYTLVPYIKKLYKVTVVTNSLLIAQSFLDTPDVQVLVPGGRLRRDSISLVGQPDSLPKINLNLGFFSVRGVADGVGASEVDHDESIMKAAMITRCVKPVLLVDGSKWGQIAPYTFLAPDQIDHIITSEDAPGDIVQHFRKLGVQVDIVPLPRY